MTQVNIDDLLREKEFSEEKPEVKKNNSKEQKDKPFFSNKKFKVPMRRKQMFLPTPLATASSRTAVEEDREFSDGVKDTAFYTSSLLMKDKEKRKILHERLKRSKYLNKYMDRKGLGIINAYLNEDLKALGVYTINYVQVYSGNEGE